MKILFINGIPDGSDKLFSICSDKLIIQHNGSSNVGNFVKAPHFERLFAVIGFNEFQVLLEHRGEIKCVFNEISDVDSHSKSLTKAESILDSMKVPIINHPKYIKQTSREKIYETLFQIDEHLIVPKTIKILAGLNNLRDQISDAGMQYPVILRRCGSHGGVDTVLLHNTFELNEFSNQLVFGKEYYLTEFYEYKDEENLYTKCRLLVIDGEVYIRHWMHSKSWLVNARNRRREYDLLEKKKIQNFDSTLKDKLQPLITKIYDVINLDYFGIDCHIDKNLNILLFELNATMDVFTSSGGAEHLAVSKITEVVNKMIQKKVESSVYNV